MAPPPHAHAGCWKLRARFDHRSHKLIGVSRPQARLLGEERARPTGWGSAGTFRAPLRGPE